MNAKKLIVFLLWAFLPMVVAGFVLREIGGAVGTTAPSDPTVATPNRRNAISLPLPAAEHSPAWAEVFSVRGPGCPPKNGGPFPRRLSSPSFSPSVPARHGGPPPGCTADLPTVFSNGGKNCVSICFFHAFRTLRARGARPRATERNGPRSGRRGYFS